MALESRKLRIFEPYGSIFIMACRLKDASQKRSNQNMRSVWKELREMKNNRSRFMTCLADLRAYASTPQGLSLQSLSSLSMSSLRRWNRRLRSRNPPMLTHTDISAKMDMERKKRMVQSVSHMLLIFLMKRFFEPSFIR